MDRTILKALNVILLSLGLALIFNFLFFGKELGVSVFIFTSILLGTVYFFGKREHVQLKKSWWIVSLILFFSLMLGIRANEFLSFLNVCAALGLLMLLAHELAGAPAFLLKIRDYVILGVWVPFRMLERAFSAVAKIGQIHSSVRNRDVWIRATKGVIMAVPLLLLFGLLFSQADLAFSQFVKSFVNISISPRTAQYSVLLFFAFVASLGFLSYIFLPKQNQPAVPFASPNADAQSNKGVEVLVFLGLISVLFLVFIGFQITYLFGGESNIVNAGFTYAEYARRGFWELLAVALLSLGVLLASEKYAGAEQKRDWQFLVPALALVAEVMVVIVSAFKRLSLYIDAYSLTTLRFYVAGFIILLFALFVLLAVKFIKLKPEHFFTFGALLLVSGFLISVNAINPDAFIVASNIKQYNEKGKIDAYYLGELSADAVPRNMELYKKLEDEDKKVLGELLEKKKTKLEQWNDDWQSTNLSRSKALKALQEF